MEKHHHKNIIAKRMPTPMGANLELSKLGSDYLSDPTYYRSIVGALQYAMTRASISFSVNKTCQFLSQPLESYWESVLRES